MRLPRYHVSVDSTKAIGKDADAQQIETLLNTAVELTWELENRNHTRGINYFGRLQDRLIRFAIDELGLDVVRDATDE